MGTEVLRPQDPMAAVDRFHATPSFHRRRHPRSSPNLIVVDRRLHNGHKKTPSPPPKRGDHRRRDVPRKAPPPLLVNCRVTILRRGESLDSLSKQGKNGLENKSSESPKLNTSDDASISGDHEDRRKSKPRGYKSCDDLTICGTRRIGPESPEPSPEQIILLPARDVYAGSAFYLSPSPRSLPLPSFSGSNSKKKAGSFYDDDVIMLEDSATMGLRRLLRLDR